jgi:carbon monoxide dehydrogenase subunit G
VADRRYCIDYERSFRFAAPLDRVWEALSRPERFPDWWSWLHAFSVEGDRLKPGTVLRGVVVPPIPFRLRLTVEIDDARVGRYVAANVHGDLEGLARVELEPRGDATEVVACWNVEMMQTPMRIAATLGMAPLLRAGHDRVVASTVESFRRRLPTES